MKRLLMILTLTSVACASVYAVPSARLNRETAYLGETVVLRISGIEGYHYDPVRQVDGVKWLQPEGERLGEDLTFVLRPMRVGTLNLGSLDFLGSDHRVVTVEFPKLTVLDHGIGDDVVLEFRTPRPKAYVGEAIPVSVRLLTSSDLVLLDERRLPKVSIDDAVWRHHTTNTDDRRLHQTSGTTKIADKTYLFSTFEGIAFPQIQGPLAGFATIGVSVWLTPNRRSNPFIEDLMPSERRLITVERRVRLAPVTVTAVSGAPDNTLDLGLVGDFKTTFTAYPETVPRDGDVTLRYTARGLGNLELCRPPVLSVRGWNCFNPQKRVDLNAQTVTVEWILQPTSHAYPLKDLVIGHFSPTEKAWKVTRLGTQVAVEGGKGSGQPPLPLVPDDGRSFRRDASVLPLVLSWLWAPIAALIVLTVLASRSPVRVRRFNRRRKRLIAALASADDNELAKLLSDDLLIALRELCGVTPGTAFREFRDRLSDDEFAAVVELALEKSYAPDSGTGVVADLVAGLKRFQPPVALLLLVLSLTGRAAETPEDAYARFDFVAAAEGFRARLGAKPTVGTMLNLGQCRYLNQDFAGAMLCAERCLRIDPRHPVARSLLQKCHEKLELTDGDSGVVGKLLPREIGLIGAVLWTFGWLIVILWAWVPSKRLLALGIVCILAGVAIGGLGWSRFRTHWDPGRMIVIREVQLHTIPDADEAGDVQAEVGGIVTLMEEREGWARVHVGERSGWVPRDRVGLLVLPSDRDRFTVY